MQNAEQGSEFKGNPFTLDRPEIGTRPRLRKRTAPSSTVSLANTPANGTAKTHQQKLKEIRVRPKTASTTWKPR